VVIRQPYTENRLAYLLRLLPPAPQRWITGTQRAISDLILGSRNGTGAALDTQMAELRGALELDPSFQQAFDADPIAATEAAGWFDLARALETELSELVALAERVAADASYRDELNADPIGTLELAGMSSDTAEQLLRALDAPDDVVARVPEVVAHVHGHQTTRTQLVLLLLRSDTVGRSIQAITRT
jgi:hypothetical protein